MRRVRPLRGTPDETRARLVRAAADEFERHGYHGTDTNRIAAAAQYAPGTFYKHFTDKRAIFLAAYDAWVEAEWSALDELVPKGDVRAIVAFVVEHHRRWRTFRASLRALVALDAVVRKAHRASRKKQLARMGSRDAGGAFLLLQVERIADAIADGELDALGVSEKRARAFLEALIRARLER